MADLKTKPKYTCCPKVLQNIFSKFKIDMCYLQLREK